MRIVLSNASYRWGGLHAVTESLARGLRARGHEVVLFCRPQSVLQARLAPLVPHEPILIGMDFSPTALWRCRRALLRHRPDVVLTLLEKDVRLTAPIARWLRIPVVVRRANDRPLKNSFYFRCLYGALPTHHIANSAATRRTILESAPWIEPSRVSVIHNGIDIDSFEAAAPANLGLPADALAIGFLGRLERRKGILDLAAAWPAVTDALPHAHLVIAGKGELEGELRARLRGAPRVHRLGYRSDVAAFLKSVAILAVPSHWEGFGMVAAEALAAGTPVVAARASSLPEILTDGVEGRLVPPENVPELARVLIELGRDAAARARMGRAGQMRARRDFCTGRMLDDYEQLLHRVAEGAVRELAPQETPAST
jgi:glycosyltransferase involved in cell wall biosynthesis